MAFIPTNLPIKINLNAKFSIHVFPWKLLINSQFSRSCTDRGSNTDLCRRGSTKVKARKSILFTEVSPEVERKSEHLFDIIITLYVAMFALGDIKIFLGSYEKDGTQSMNDALPLQF